MNPKKSCLSPRRSPTLSSIRRRSFFSGTSRPVLVLSENGSMEIARPHDEFKKQIEEGLTRTIRTLAAEALSLHTSAATRGTPPAAVSRRVSERRRYLIDPRNSHFIRPWDLTTSLALLFTAIVTPFDVSFLKVTVGRMRPAQSAPSARYRHLSQDRERISSQRGGRRQRTRRTRSSLSTSASIPSSLPISSCSSSSCIRSARTTTARAPAGSTTLA